MSHSAPFEGWTVEEAIRRTIDPALLDALAKARGLPSKFTPPFECVIWEHDPKFRRIARTSTAAITGEKASAVAEAGAKIETEFLSHLSAGRLVIKACRGKATGDPIILSPRACAYLRIYSAQNSILQDRTGSRDKFYDTRVFPVLLSEVAAEWLHGLGIAEAFKTLILDDPEVLLLGRRIVRMDSLHRDVFHAGQLPGYSAEFRWLVDFDVADLADRFVMPSATAAWQELPQPAKIYEQASQAIVGRWSALVRLLRGGHIVASGTHATTGEFIPIQRRQWARGNIAVDVRSGDLIEWQGSQAVVLWSGLELTMAARPESSGLIKSHVKPHIYERVPTRAIGHFVEGDPPKKAVARAAASAKLEQECAAWMIEVIQASPGKRTVSKLALVQQAREKWPALSERAALRAREHAIRATNAVGWAASGAPRKSMRQQSRRHD